MTRSSLLAFLIFLFVAAGSASAAPSPRPCPAVAPFSLTPASADYTPGKVRENQEFSIEIRNTGTRHLVVEAAKVSDPHCVASVPQAPIPPNRSASIAVRCERLPYGTIGKDVWVKAIDSGRCSFAPQKTTLVAHSFSPEQRSDADCGSVNLTAPGGTLEGLQKQPQAFGTCAYHAGAVLFDAERLKNVSPRTESALTSAIMTAYEVKRLNPKATDFEGGTTYTVLEHLAANGGCPALRLGDLRKSKFFRLMQERDPALVKYYEETAERVRQARETRNAEADRIANQPARKAPVASGWAYPPPPPSSSPAPLPASSPSPAPSPSYVFIVPKETKEAQVDRLERELLYNIILNPGADLNEEFLRVVDSLSEEKNAIRKQLSMPAQIDSVNRVEADILSGVGKNYGMRPGGSYAALDQLFREEKYLDFSEKAVGPGCSAKKRLRAPPAKIRTVLNDDYFDAIKGKAWADATRESYPGQRSKGLSQSRIKRWIHSQYDRFGKRAKPLGISFCTYATNDHVDFPRFGGRCGSHAAVLVGRRKDARGRCLLGIQSAGIIEWEPIDIVLSNTREVIWLE